MAKRIAAATSCKIVRPLRRAKPAVTILQAPAPALPHERDLSAASQRGEPREVIRQAAADLKHGQQDTDRSAQMNQTYKKLKGKR